MTNSVFDFMVSCFARLLAICTSLDISVVDISLGDIHYTMSILDCAISFLIFDLSMVILAIPVQGAIGHALSGLDDAFIDD